MSKYSSEQIEKAAQAAYQITVEKAPKYYDSPEDLTRYVPWDKISERWREDYKSTILAALETLDA